MHRDSPMTDTRIRTSTLLMLAGVAVLATLLGQSWQAAEQQRPLDASDLRTALFVALAVVGALWLSSASRKVAQRGTFPRFDGTSRAALVAAQDDAMDLGLTYVGTEHILAGLLAAPDGRATRLLASYGIDLPVVRREVGQLAQRGEAPDHDEPGLTPRAKRAVEQAIATADELGQREIHELHLLAGLARVEESLAAQVLQAAGVDLAELQRALAAQLREQHDQEA